MFDSAYGGFVQSELTSPRNASLTQPGSCSIKFGRASPNYVLAMANDHDSLSVSRAYPVVVSSKGQPYVHAPKAAEKKSVGDDEGGEKSKGQA